MLRSQSEVDTIYLAWFIFQEEEGDLGHFNTFFESTIVIKVHSGCNITVVCYEKELG